MMPHGPQDFVFHGDQLRQMSGYFASFTGRSDLSWLLVKTAPIIFAELLMNLAESGMLNSSASFLSSGSKIIGDIDFSLCPIGSVPVTRKFSPRISVRRISSSWKSQEL